MKTAFLLVLSLVLSLAVRAQDAARSAARLLPPDTLVFAELHDLPRTAERLKETCWAELARDPEVSQFVEQIGGAVRQFVKSAEQGREAEAFGVLRQIAKADPVSAFFAMTDVPAPGPRAMPKMVFGVSYRGEPEHVEALLQKLRDAILGNGNAGIKSSKEAAEGAEIETFSDDDMSLSVVHADRWVLMATDRHLMLDTLARRTAQGTGSLAETDAWKAAQKEAVAEPDLTAFVLYEAVIKKMIGAGGEEAAVMAALKDFLPQSISVSTKLDGRLMRERAYMQYSIVLPRAESKHRSLAFAGEETFAYVESEMAGLDMMFEKFIEALPEIRNIPDLEKHALSVADIPKTFGPEIAMLSDWDSGALAIPTFFAAVEVRDAEKARKFAELIAAEMSSEGQVTEGDYHGTKLWSVKGPVGFLQPTLALNGTHMMFGLNRDSVTAALDGVRGGKPSLAGTAAFTGAMKTVGDANGGLAYVDSARLVERLWDRGRPFIANAIAGDERLSKSLDASLLPKAATLARHLPPFVASFHSREHGYMMESTGPLSYLTGVGGVAFVAGFTLPVLTAAKQKAAAEAAAPQKDR